MLVSDIYAIEMKDGRLPEGITRRLGFWKAEEIQKFAYPASEVVFGGIIPEDKYRVWVAAVRIVECLFSCGRNGISQDLLSTLQKLIWRHNILCEQVYGGKICTISLHNLTHLIDDISRFSSPDNFWCYAFERAVRTYVERSSNSKQLELTFAKAESRREVLKFLCTDDTSFTITCSHHTNPSGCLEKVYMYSVLYKCS